MTPEQTPAPDRLEALTALLDSVLELVESDIGTHPQRLQAAKFLNELLKEWWDELDPEAAAVYERVYQEMHEPRNGKRHNGASVVLVES